MERPMLADDRQMAPIFFAMNYEPSTMNIFFTRTGNLSVLINVM